MSDACHETHNTYQPHVSVSYSHVVLRHADILNTRVLGALSVALSSKSLLRAISLHVGSSPSFGNDGVRGRSSSTPDRRVGHCCQRRGIRQWRKDFAVSQRLEASGHQWCLADGREPLVVNADVEERQEQRRRVPLHPADLRHEIVEPPHLRQREPSTIALQGFQALPCFADVVFVTQSRRPATVGQGDGYVLVEVPEERAIAAHVLEILVGDVAQAATVPRRSVRRVHEVQRQAKLDFDGVELAAAEHQIDVIGSPVGDVPHFLEAETPAIVHLHAADPLSSALVAPRDQLDGLRLVAILEPGRAICRFDARPSNAVGRVRRPVTVVRRGDPEAALALCERQGPMQRHDLLQAPSQASLQCVVEALQPLLVALVGLFEARLPAFSFVSSMPLDEIIDTP